MVGAGAAGAPVTARVVPVQPPFGAPDIPTEGLPSSVPARWFGGASAGSASPFAFARSRALAPAASQTAIAAPRVDPLQAVERTVPLQGTTSPTRSSPRPAGSSPRRSRFRPFGAGRSQCGAERAPRDDAAGRRGLCPPAAESLPALRPRRPVMPFPATPPRRRSLRRARRQSRQRPLFTTSIRFPAELRSVSGAARSGPPDALWPSPELSPFSAPIDLGAAQRGLNGATFKAPSSDAASARAFRRRHRRAAHPLGSG